VAGTCGRGVPHIGGCSFKLQGLRKLKRMGRNERMNRPRARKVEAKQ